MNHKKDNGFVLNNYGRQSVFASFLPGISGKKGIPIWCHYVNRGQGIVSFGVEDKDHAIMEFYPAHQSYQYAKTTGFRTFMRVNGNYIEPFSDVEIPHSMKILMNGMEIQEENPETGIVTQVTYHTLPSESIGGLIRKVTVTNLSKDPLQIEILDGMPAVVPYGIDMRSLKEMGQTIKAWMQVEDIESNIPYYRVRASTSDTASVNEMKGGNFSCAYTSEGEQLSPIVDPSVIFAYDDSLQIAKVFQQKGLDDVYNQKQVLSNQYPCSFYGLSKKLEVGEQFHIYHLIGQVVNKETLKRYFSQTINASYFEEKIKEADTLTEELTKVIQTKTGHNAFDEYCRYTYMDNVLRGGYPVILPGNKIFYMYSRKHGDIERDYNFFRMLPEFYSQGNGNFRDVNQNRRMDNFFSPYVGEENIRRFYSLIQLDGYNPLAVEKVTYSLSEEDITTIFDLLTQEQKEELISYLSGAFTPGGFYQKLGEIGILEEEKQDLYFEKVMEKAKDTLNADFGEGYWSDHWTYNLDLIESYLSLYPEKEKELLLGEHYTYFCSQVPILPRIKRYVKTDNGIRQYHFLEEDKKRTDSEKVVKEQYGKGNVIKVTLLEKLLVLCVTKYAALDVYGMGVEMEGGKPGWYDALNGLPGLFGSSMAETYELARNLEYTIGAVQKCSGEITLLKEVGELLQSLDAVTMLHKNEIVREKELLEFWNKRNQIKEKYQQNTFYGISGETVVLESTRVEEILRNYLETVTYGIRKACSITKDICPTYFAYEVTEYTETNDGIVPEHFEVIKIPSFLEGPVRYLKLNWTIAQKLDMYKSVKNSDLYDKKLQMYKVNESLKNASFEIGRAKAFTPGWLENESIWLHMEYKYLLELLKSGMYKEYLEDFQKAAIPFQDPEVYGRSIYENSSFIASSQNPNEKYHGKGFVARLSGSTVEFLQMWKIMMFGKDTFTAKDGSIALCFQPLLPKSLIGKDKIVEAVFLGTIQIIYHFEEQKDYIPGEYIITKMQLQYRDGSSYQTTKATICNSAAYDVRKNKVSTIHIYIQ